MEKKIFGNSNLLKIGEFLQKKIVIFYRKCIIKLSIQKSLIRKKLYLYRWKSLSQAIIYSKISQDFFSSLEQKGYQQIIRKYISFNTVGKTIGLGMSNNNTSIFFFRSDKSNNDIFLSEQYSNFFGGRFFSKINKIYSKMACGSVIIIKCCLFIYYNTAYITCKCAENFQFTNTLNPFKMNSYLGDSS